jgi:RNA methyltransferase, TrmH family
VLNKSRVKYIQSLYHKKFRDEEQVFVIEGPKIVAEFLAKYSQQVNEVYAINKWIESNRLHLNDVSVTKLIEVDENDLKRISALSTPNQVLALVKKKDEPFPTIKTGEIVLMLDDIQDPGNVGTIIRTADWFGINKILCSSGCADVYSPKVIQSTMGSIMRIAVLYTDLPEWCDQHRHLHFYGATLSGRSVYEYDPINGGVLIIGNESKGIQQALLSKCNDLLTIPGTGGAESLNASVATGIVLSHLIKNTH